ncbi:ankyrin [Penicillium sp. DV-2018c]|nr:ankyrin [Penicillium sp. DV-2018c]KAJ5571230.1 ankyrin [Penicillium sp. DV-2018c]
MQSISVPFLCLPTEILEIIAIELEYASEVNSLSQTCHRLHSIANRVLFKYYAKECSPAGFDRIVMNNNVAALCKLLANGADFDEYYRADQDPTPIRLTVEKDLSNIAKVLMPYVEVMLKDLKRKYGYLSSDPSERSFKSRLAITLTNAAKKGSLGVLKEISSSPAVEVSVRTEALGYAVCGGQVESARYLIDHAGVDVNSRTTLPCSQETYLAEAARRGDLEMVKVLVGAGADLKCPDYDDIIVKSPLFIAAASDHNAIVQYLIEKGMCFSPLKLHDIVKLAEYSWDATYKTSRIVRGDDIRALLASPEYNAGYAKDCCTVAAACGDQSLFRDIRELPDSSLDRGDFLRIFAIAVINGQIPFVEYLVGEMRKLESMSWKNAWELMLDYTIDHYYVPAFNVLLDSGVPTDLLKGKEGWLSGVLSRARREPRHLKALLVSSYLQGHRTRNIRVLVELFACAFQIGELVYICQLLHTSEFGLLDTLSHPGYCSQRSILQITARYSSVETFNSLLDMHNLTLDPCHPAHCAALLSATLESNIDLLEFFLKSGFDVNALYEKPSSGRHHAAETLLIHVATSQCSPSRFWRGHRDTITTTAEYLLDRGAHVDAKSSKGFTALSIALRNKQIALARMLFNRGADPLLGLESRNETSGLELLLQHFQDSQWDDDVTFLDMLQASLELMVVRGYKSDEFLQLMPRNEGSLSHPHLADAPEEGGLRKLRRSHFLLIKTLRQYYWRSRYPVSSE